MVYKFYLNKVLVFFFFKKKETSGWKILMENVALIIRCKSK